MYGTPEAPHQWPRAKSDFATRLRRPSVGTGPRWGRLHYGIGDDVTDRFREVLGRRLRLDSALDALSL